jgi:hypothetical protein
MRMGFRIDIGISLVSKVMVSTAGRTDRITTS